MTIFSSIIAGGMINGYLSARLMRLFKKPKVKFGAALSSFVLPTIMLVVFGFVDLIEYFEKAD